MSEIATTCKIFRLSGSVFCSEKKSTTESTDKMISGDFAPIPASRASVLLSRVGRVIADCFPGADIKFSRFMRLSKEFVDREAIDVITKNYVITAVVTKCEDSSYVILSSYYFGRFSKTISPTLVNPSSEEIRKALVDVSVDSFKNYCLN